MEEIHSHSSHSLLHSFSANLFSSSRDASTKTFSTGVDFNDMVEIWGAGLQDVTMHEVGHTLGLRHNFKASKHLPFSKRADVQWIRQNGLATSVMDYLPVNLPKLELVKHLSKKEKLDLMFMQKIGVYDIMAIKYGYSEFKEIEKSAAIYLGKLN